MSHLLKGQISFVIPYYNEEEFLIQTLESLVQQERMIDQLILVDNASKDRSTELAQEFLSHYPDILVKYLYEERPGKVNALELAIQNLETEYASFGDADTLYPPHYVHKLVSLFESLPSRYVALMALPVFEEMDCLEREEFIESRLSAALKYPSKCFTGGFGQTFKTKDLILAGGFSFQQWPYCLMDHEVMNRVHRYGDSYYDEELWCTPSSRREGKRSAVRWNLFERMVYKYTPSWMNDWVFYKLLWNSFALRGLGQINLRQKAWTSPS